MNALCSLGKRKASERNDEDADEPRHAKRAAVISASAPGERGSAADGRHISGGLQPAGNDTQGVAEPHRDSFQGVAAQSMVREPDPQQAAVHSRDNVGESLATVYELAVSQSKVRTCKT